MPSISAPSSGLPLAQPTPPNGGRPVHQTPIRPTSDDTTQSATSSKDGQSPSKREPQSDTTTTLPLPVKDEASMTASRSLEPLAIPRTRVHKAPLTPTRLPHEFDHIAYMEDMETDNRRYSEAKGLEKFMPEDGITPITELDEPLRLDVESLRSLSRCHALGDDLDAMSNHEAEKVNIIMAMLRKVKSATNLVVITTSHPFTLTAAARPGTRLGRGPRPRSRDRPKSPTSPIHSRATSDSSTLDVPEEKPPMVKSWLFSVPTFPTKVGTVRKVTV